MALPDPLAIEIAEALGLKTSPEKLAAFWAMVNAGAPDLSADDLRNLLSDVFALGRGSLRDAQHIRWLENGHGETEPPKDPADLAKRMRAHVNRRIGAEGEKKGDTTGYLANGAWAMLIEGANTIDALLKPIPETAN